MVISYMSPKGLVFTVLGIPLMTIWSAAGMFVYFLARASLFLAAAMLMARVPANSPEAAS